MTLSIASPTNTYIGTGAASVYAFTFPIFNNTDLTLTVTSPTGVAYGLTLGTDYTVSNLNPSGGPAVTGSITLVNNSQAWLTAGSLTTNWTLTITRVVSIIQNTSLRNQGDYFPEVIENQLDYLTMICQQLEQAIQLLQAGSQLAATVIVTDLTNGHTYQIITSGGVLGTLQIT